MAHSYYPRFSLLSLLLAITVAAVAVSHWLTSRELRIARDAIKEEQRTIRRLNDQLGHLTIDDPARVHIIALFDPTLAPKDYGAAFTKQDNLGWRVHFPAGTRWNLYASFAGIPKQGFPVPTSDVLLPVSKGQVCDIYFSCRQSSSLGWVAELAFEDQVERSFIPTKQAEWLSSTEPCEGECAGECQGFPSGLHGYCTESFGPDEKIILLRQRRMMPPATTNRPWNSDPNPCQGLMIWLEPAAANRK